MLPIRMKRGGPENSGVYLRSSEELKKNYDKLMIWVTETLKHDNEPHDPVACDNGQNYKILRPRKICPAGPLEV